jgi:hypothetical protein
MSYEVERNVKIEIVDESLDGDCGPFGIAEPLGRCATRLPAYTEEEMEAGLGKELYDQIGRLFDNIESSSRQS